MVESAAPVQMTANSRDSCEKVVHSQHRMMAGTVPRNISPGAGASVSIGVPGGSVVGKLVSKPRLFVRTEWVE